MEDPISPTEEELFVGLTKALVSATPSSAPASASTSREALDRQVHLLIFERDQARALMLDYPGW